MKQILIATHGKMASGICYTAELIVGKMAEITTIDAYVTPEDNVEKKFEEYFAQHENDRIFVFTDLMGGSVNQKLLGYSQKENVTLITGTNLPVSLLIMCITIHCEKFKIMVLCKIYINISCKKAEIFWLPYGDSSVYFGFNIVISQIFRIENPFLL